jgi:hypothetical protein
MKTVGRKAAKAQGARFAAAAELFRRATHSRRCNRGLRKQEVAPRQAGWRQGVIGNDEESDTARADQLRRAVASVTG